MHRRQNLRISKRNLLSALAISRRDPTLKDLLEASFAEWPIRGLDIATEPLNVTIPIREIDSRLPLSALARPNQNPARSNLASLPLGAATADGEILINRSRKAGKTALDPQSHFPDTLAHETAHILQLMHSKYAHALFHIPGARLIHQIYPYEDLLPQQPIAHALLEHVDPHYQNEPLVPNLLDGMELQANIGMEFSGHPQTLVHSSNSTAIDAIVANFPRLTASHSQLADATMVLTEQGRNLFYDHVLPRLYADLLEMYGDRTGRERFGYGSNETYKLHCAAAGDAPYPDHIRPLLTPLSQQHNPLAA